MDPSKPHPLRKFVPLIVVLATLLGFVSPSAIAGARSSIAMNICDEGYTALLQNRPLVKYANTGKLSSHWKPAHSRAFYMALLGMHDLLRSYLKKHSKLLQNSDLLTAATYSGRKRIVVMLLEMGETLNRSGPDTSALPLLIAADCVRPTIMTYLLSAGADVYGVSDNLNAMATALVPALTGASINLESVRLLLAAGFDPRCPVTAKGETAVDVVRKWKGGKTWLETKHLIMTAATIASIRKPGKPDCGESARFFIR